MTTADLKALFSSGTDGTVLVITVGNLFRGDDGAGPYIAGNVGVPAGNLFVMDAGDRPESILDRVPDIKPQKTIIIDAADFGGAAGEIRLIPEDTVSNVILSTHRFPLAAIGMLIAADTGSEVNYLGIQPAELGFGQGLSPEVRKAADAIAEVLLNG